jgi:hypothetical protein
MPILNCSEINSNPDSKLSVEIKLIEHSEEWQNYQIVFHKGQEKYNFKSKNRQVTTYTGDMQAEIGKFAFALKPINELYQIKTQLENFLLGKIPSFIFQPVDPSFELEIKKINNNEFKVYFWVDAGNTSQLEYTWDAIGLRFITSRSELESFLNSL